MRVRAVRNDLFGLEARGVLGLIGLLLTALLTQ
jgi:hypothetical protein